VALRRALARDGQEGDAERLVNAESDGLPGIVVDRYAGVLVCQFLSAGAELWREDVVAELVAMLAPESVYERSDVDVREREGLQPRAGLLWGAEPADHVEIHEGRAAFSSTCAPATRPASTSTSARTASSCGDTSRDASC
jgi:23S rRNA (cytosine1962-C5)-methyltransferase